MSDLPAPTTPCGGPALHDLRRFDTDELPAAHRARVQTHVDACEACRAQLREFAADRSAVALAVPFEALANRFDKPRMSLSSLLRRLAVALALPAAAAAGTAFLLSQPVDDGVRSKGGPLEFVVKTADGTRPGADGEALHPGDSIRLRYDASLRPYVLIVGVDADARVFTYLADRDRSAAAASLKDFAPNAITLDQDQRPERVFAFFSNEPIGVDEVRPAAVDALKAAGSIAAVKELPIGVKGVEQATFLLNKAP